MVADEAVWTPRDLREIIRRHAADTVNIKLAKTGGQREAPHLVAWARVSETKIIVGCMAESHVGIGAAAALASVVDKGVFGKVTAHDLDGGLLLTHSPVVGESTTSSITWRSLTNQEAP
jgi:L-alanine-DL-glutamate epimerase-like enolase superfamily enzyme